MDIYIVVYKSSSTLISKSFKSKSEMLNFCGETLITGSGTELDKIIKLNTKTLFVTECELGFLNNKLTLEDFEDLPF